MSALQGRRTLHSTSIESDQPAHRLHPAQHARQDRLVPLGLDVCDPATHEHDVQRPATGHLVRDVRTVRCSRELRLDVHTPIVDDAWFTGRSRSGSDARRFAGQGDHVFNDLVDAHLKTFAPRLFVRLRIKRRPDLLGWVVRRKRLLQVPRHSNPVSS